MTCREERDSSELQSRAGHVASTLPSQMSAQDTQNSAPAGQGTVLGSYTSCGTSERGSTVRDAALLRRENPNTAPVLPLPPSSYHTPNSAAPSAQDS